MRRARPLLGTYVEIEAVGLAEAALERAIGAAFDAVGLVQRLMSFRDPDSDLSALNRRAAREPVRAHPWTARVLRCALSMFQETDGLFDCAVGYELARWGLLPSDGSSHVRHGSLSAVRALPDNQFVFAAPVALDFGGIAKGFAVDRAIAALRRHGVREASVNAGGDMRVIGRDARPIHIRHPTDPARLSLAGLLQNGAIATSSAAQTLQSVSGREVSALVASRTRAPIVELDAYSVVAPSCMIADALTKVLAQTKQTDSPYLRRFGATGLITPRFDELEAA